MEGTFYFPERSEWLGPLGQGILGLGLFGGDHSLGIVGNGAEEDSENGFDSGVGHGFSSFGILVVRSGCFCMG